MSYQTYITEALIVGSFDNNTADKSYLLFTKSAGMIYASAKSVREERSRQRFALQDFGLITVSLIKGKTGWRIGSVQSLGNVFSGAPNRLVRGSVVRTVKFLRRFVGAEEPVPQLYDEISEGLHYLCDASLPKRVLIEEIIQARILYELGYIAEGGELIDVLTKPLSEVLTQELPESILPKIRAITDNARLVSHL